jgi:hypothetical protein
VESHINTQAVLQFKDAARMYQKSQAQCFSECQLYRLFWKGYEPLEPKFTGERGIDFMVAGILHVFRFIVG